MIKNDYPQIIFSETVQRPYCYIGINIVYVYEDMLSANDDDLFDVLHELGHLFTSTEDMTQYQRELLATKWAIKQCSKYNIVVSTERQTEWADYLDSWFRRSYRTSRTRSMHVNEKLNWT